MADWGESRAASSCLTTRRLEGGATVSLQGMGPRNPQSDQKYSLTDTRSVTADPDGRFKFEGLQPGQYLINPQLDPDVPFVMFRSGNNTFNVQPGATVETSGDSAGTHRDRDGASHRRGNAERHSGTWSSRDSFSAPRGVAPRTSRRRRRMNRVAIASRLEKEWFGSTCQINPNPMSVETTIRSPASRSARIEPGRT